MKKVIILLVVAALFFGGCASMSPTQQRVLSGGAIGSPHLLLLSGIGPRAELEAAGSSGMLVNTSS